MAEQPLLLRLKELDSLKEMAAKVQEVRLVVGSNAMTGLVPSEFFAETRDREAKTGSRDGGPGPVTGRGPIHYLGAQAPSKLPFEP